MGIVVLGGPARRGASSWWGASGGRRGTSPLLESPVLQGLGRGPHTGWGAPGWLVELGRGLVPGVHWWGTLGGPVVEGPHRRGWGRVVLDRGCCLYRGLVEGEHSVIVWRGPCCQANCMVLRPR